MLPRQGARVRYSLEIDAAAELSESDLLLVGRLPAPVAGAVGGRAFGQSKPRYLVLPSVPQHADAHTARVLVYCPAHGEPKVNSSIRGSQSVTIDAAMARERMGTVQKLAREALAWLDPETRAGVLEFVITATSSAQEQAREVRDLRLSASLHALREALRERLPVSLTQDGPMALIDAIARVDRDAFFMRGRVRSGPAWPARVTMVSPEGSRVEILEHAYWCDATPSRERSDDNAWKGFEAFITTAPSALREGWLAELETQTGELLEVGAPRVVTHVTDVIRVVLEDFGRDRPPPTSVIVGHVLPAIRRLQRVRQHMAFVDRVVQFGPPPDSPTVSVIVPLYGRIDLVEHQLTQFADDPCMRNAELIYVLDDPRLRDELFDLASRLFPHYRQPFKVAALSSNTGFAGANNFGASMATGRLLLLLNSDVFPESPGWLEAIVHFHDSLSNVGAVGPKLVYEDDTLQHAGMFFQRFSDDLPWNNEHYFKGMHRDLPAAATSRPVPAVTGACMLIARDLFNHMGGLSGEYLQGDYEDSDLCLRLLEAGRQNWYFADVALYHLEGSSYDPDRRRLVQAFNRWLHTYIWGKRLRALGGSGDVRIARRSASPPVEDLDLESVAPIRAPALS
jgi:GT2 family glycosyltransferase